ncbi:uncharacterized protein [Aristolochia californica]|uniref:uncharacterized protein isoform X4 n=1 Tax=Aristolochia californica TaxID=171875 RepID=UPI0035E2B7B5
MTSPLVAIPGAVDEEVEEEEDVDFNPFLKPSLSPEASSSLSSESEPNANGGHHTSSSIQVQYNADNNEGEEEGVMQADDNLGNRDDGIYHTTEEDPICRRTRARYSLANFSLDELETFLQETDDEEDFQNADDEEEYRKFLTAVLNGGEEEVDSTTKNLSDEEDEDDADFELEIEEALESETDENRSRIGKSQDENSYADHRRPETRQNRRQNISARNKKKFLGQTMLPLRPILPSNAPTAAMYPSAAETVVNGAPNLPHPGMINGFTAHQIGQLYCLIHEHVQLLIQVFSLCVFEPSKQHIASDVQRLIMELIRIRNEALLQRKDPHPKLYFQPPHVHPSVSEDPPKSNSNLCLGQMGESSIWIPVVGDSVMTILDVPPLGLAGKYVADVTNAVQEYTERHLHDVHGSSLFERVPLFPLPRVTPMSEIIHPDGGPLLGRLEVQEQNQQPKKTLAGTLVESSKKQSVAVVPKNIVDLAQKFFSLFNSALFPHKPPSAPVANRVLFTDAEDELLALGLMEYNNDWKAIQHRFLPCKTKHQIFVRAKNRSSSKAPENPIKAVRRMKTSPLTAEEKALIHEGLRVFKLDWMSVWKFYVPYRDPSLLPRQWRTAMGTQKSYKMDEASKEKRRLYEMMRRQKCKVKSSLNSSQVGTSNGADDIDQIRAVDGVDNTAEDNLDEEGEVYMHEALLANYRPENIVSTSLSISSIGSLNYPSNSRLPQEGSLAAENRSRTRDACQEPFQSNVSSNELVATQKSSYIMQHVSQYNNVTYNASYTVASQQWISKPPVSNQPYRACKSNTTRMVKLAPDLPPVDLPPSVRVISKSSFLRTAAIDNVTNMAATTETYGKNQKSLILHPPQVDDCRWTTAMTSSKAKALDLTIGLSSATGKEKLQKQRGEMEYNASGSNTSVSHNTINKEDQRADMEHSITRTSLQIHPCDDFEDLSPPGIVMEQEELSDSDEGIEEGVQFECEEMSDSDGEEVDCAHHPDTLVKLPATIDEEIGERGLAEQSSMKGNAHSQKPSPVANCRNVANLTGTSSESFTLGPSIQEQERENRRDRSCEKSTSNGVRSHPNRLRRRKPTKEEVRPEIPQLGDVAANTMSSKRKSRKRMCRSDPKSRPIGNMKGSCSENSLRMADPKMTE